MDNGSTWHSGATTSNGAAAGEGYTLDATRPFLDKGNSIYDIRHRLVVNYVWELPGQSLTGIKGALLGGWTYNGIWAFQSGPHWEPFDKRSASFKATTPGFGKADCKSAATFAAAGCENIGGDYNLDHGRNDRPDSTLSSFNPDRKFWEVGWATAGMDPTTIFSSPCLGCTSNLGRNTFVGPGTWSADMTMAKMFKLTERFNLRFETLAFNVFNRANFVLATTGGAAMRKGALVKVLTFAGFYRACSRMLNRPVAFCGEAHGCPLPQRSPGSPSPSVNQFVAVGSGASRDHRRQNSGSTG